ncbi:MAG: PD-(D/E)XK nuclease family protein [Clostridia bacterium]|nr:PD-(D/E)XK nuclease family protein [Clostridia bacterium]
MINLFTCDSYFELFNILTEQLKEHSNSVDKKRVVFCEAKVSLMIERYLCGAFGGAFNTKVYSFGKYLIKKEPLKNVLSKEGSAMAIKRILNKVSLKSLKNSKANLASTLYDLIIQLKSAKIEPEVLADGVSKSSFNVLKNKLDDVARIYYEYEKFLIESCADDQSSILKRLPEVIASDDEIKESDVYIVGFSGFTAQVRAGLESLMENARSFTAIFTEGENLQAFVNETAEFIRALAKNKGFPLVEKRVRSGYSLEAKRIIDNLFTPVSKNTEKIKTDKVFCLSAKSSVKEIDRIANIIKGKVLSGECRYRDFTVAIPENSIYGGLIADTFNSYGISYFLDEKLSVHSHPLVTLILAFIDSKRRNYESKTLAGFYKNPLFTDDKTLADRFENYCLKYNVNFKGVEEPFTFEESGGSLATLNSFREKIINTLTLSSIKEMLESLAVKGKLEKLTKTLTDLGEEEQAGVNAQIYDAVSKLLDEMEVYLGGVKMPVSEYRAVFVSGVNAMELSIIPQFNDAVFVGDYKQTALAKAKFLFAVGLTDAVPAIKQDVSLLTDVDIDRLEEVKLKVEPKIKVINHRTREAVALALGAWEEGLYLSYPLSTVEGKENVKSDVFKCIEQLFLVKPFPEGEEYLTKKQGKKNFARSVSSFAEGYSDDLTSAVAFYNATSENELDVLLDNANKELKTHLELSGEELAFEEISPTTIEDYFECPYRAFLSRTLGINKREEGKVDALSVGNLMHEIMKDYVKRIEEVADQETSDKLFDKVCEKIFKDKKYEKYQKDVVTKNDIVRALTECRKYCYRTYLAIKNGAFKPKDVELSFGGDTAISLNGGKVKLKGKVDRVDLTDDYFRILDYKTGKVKGSDAALYYGQELQLYLYAKAYKQQHENLTPAGLYYLPISDKFETEDDKEKAMAKGKTLNEESALIAQDEEFFKNAASDFMPVSIDEKSGGIKNALSREDMDSYVEYAYKVSDIAAKQLCEGVIVPSPAKEACKYCDYKAMCKSAFVGEREERTVTSKTIIDAVKGGAENGELD